MKKKLGGVFIFDTSMDSLENVCRLTLVSGYQFYVSFFPEGKFTYKLTNAIGAQRVSRMIHPAEHNKTVKVALITL